MATTFSRLEGAEIFATGKWNGLDFTDDDLDKIVQSFEFFDLSGRIPLKFGHNSEQPLTDGQPALGWVDRIWREGSKLLADFRDVPRVVYDAIKSGRYKHVSVELLRDVTAGNRTVPLVLDAVALLGADLPAVGTLKDLQTLTMSGLREQSREHFACTVALSGGEAANLRREIDRLQARNHRQSVDATIEGDVRARVVMPAAREQFRRLFKLTDDDASYGRITPSDWHAFRATQPRPPERGAATHAADWGGAAPDATLVAMTRQYLADNALRHLQLTGERLTFDRAAVLVAREVARSNPSLLRAYADQPGEAD